MNRRFSCLAKAARANPALSIAITQSPMRGHQQMGLYNGAHQYSQCYPQPCGDFCPKLLYLSGDVVSAVLPPCLPPGVTLARIAPYRPGPYLGGVKISPPSNPLSSYHPPHISASVTLRGPLLA
jgi:hypothetical protein